MARYVFDIEADGLLPTVTKVHCIVLKNESDEVFSFGPDMLHVGLGMLAEAELLIGHNIIKYDLPVLRKLYPPFKTNAILRDTLVACKLIWPQEIIFARDTRAPKERRVPSHLLGRQALEAWGYRLDCPKGTFDGPWDTWSQEMQSYCEQDVEVNDKLRLLIEKQNYSERALQLENDVQEIIHEQEQYGICFDVEAGRKLYATLVQLRLTLERECQKIFAPWFIPNGKLFTPKRDNKKFGYTAGCPLQHIKLVEFNPGSRDQIIDRFTKLRGWKPEEFTDGGKAKMDEAVLSGLPYPEARELGRFWLISKRISQLAEGDKALLKKVQADGRIYGEVNTCGAVTRRASHHNPNLAQVPKVQVDRDKNPLLGETGDFGFEFRSCFYAPSGYKMVGVDASGLELRLLAHYLAKWDGGEYAKQVLEGDPHEYTRDRAGLASRDVAKTYIYALLYGAGNEKLGRTSGQGASAGKRSRAHLLAGMPALERLISLCKAKHFANKNLKGLDGGLIHTRSDYAALNTLLQSAGAIVCKEWMVRLHKAATAAGLNFHQVLFVHDELQFYVLPEHAEQLIQIAKDCIKETGESFNLRIKLDAEGKVGDNWANTH